ncbi:MAG: hypothetical protein A3J83_07700 [Elusimicrobia bacterium RIFOXYA2_FULL_40_6]|nr:MAG: hypothetical protein A3J83_07700 [Elusimicrobia bacterium RIFOXYA2_FULL_40_6]
MIIKSGRRLKLELIKFTVYVAVLILLLVSINFYWFLTTILPPTMLSQSAARIAVFSVISIFLIWGITVLLVKWFTFSVLGPMPRLQREITRMAESEKYHCLTVRDKDKIGEFIEVVNLLIKKLSPK